MKSVKEIKIIDDTKIGRGETETCSEIWDTLGEQSEISEPNAS